MSKLALLGGEPIRSRPWSPWPDPREEDVEAVAAVVRSGRWWSYAGSEVRQVEEEFAAYHDCRWGVSVNSGTTALHVALEAMGIGPGDEVIVPAYTFQATATSVLLTNAVPIFADIEPHTLNLDPEAAAAAVTPRTRALLPVHIGGLPADMARLGELAQRHGLMVLEDCAQAHGAVWRGCKVGAIGRAGAFSFQASKNLCAGEGGMITTNDDELAARAAGLRDCGRVEGRPFYEHHLPGYNFRLTEMQGALLRSRMRHLEEETARRYCNGQRLSARLRQLPGIEPFDPPPAEGDRRAYHIYLVRVDAQTLDGLSRDRFMEALNAEGVPCWSGYGWPLYRNPIFRDEHFRPKGCPVRCPSYQGQVNYREVSCPVAERVCGETIVLSQNLLLGSQEETEQIADAFEKVATERRALMETGARG